MRITPFKLLFIDFFILMQPVVNNLNGISMKYYNISIIGPLFFASSFLLFMIFGLASKKNLPFLIFLGLFVVYFLTMVFINRMALSDVGVFTKVPLPFLIFLVIKNLSLTSKKTRRIINAIIFSSIMYSIIIIACAIFGYKYFENKGVTGFIQGINELTVLFMLFVFFFSILKTKSIKKNILTIVAYILIRSKAAIIMIPLYLSIFLKRINLFYKLAVLFFSVVLFKFIVFDYVADYTKIYFKKAENIRALFMVYDSDYLLKNFSFGRSDYAQLLFKNKMGIDEIFLGVGKIKLKIMIPENHGGVEMDILDAFASYGILGIILLLGFYYYPIFHLKISIYSKLIFVVIVLYSIFGGHFMNPLCSVYYGVILGILKNKNQRVIGEFFEIRNGDQYSRAL